MRVREREQSRPKDFVEIRSALTSVGQLLPQSDEPRIKLGDHGPALERFLERRCRFPSRIASEVLPEADNQNADNPRVRDQCRSPASAKSVPVLGLNKTSGLFRY